MLETIFFPLDLNGTVMVSRHTVYTFQKFFRLLL